jgi:hypothetical protein
METQTTLIRRRGLTMAPVPFTKVNSTRKYRIDDQMLTEMRPMRTVLRLFALVLLAHLAPADTHAQYPNGLDAARGLAPRPLIQHFRLAFQQRADRWDRPQHERLRAILRELDLAQHEYPKDVRLRWWKGMALLELGQYGEAAATFQEISISRTSYRDSARAFLIVALWRGGDYGRAWENLKPHWKAILWHRFQPAASTVAWALLTCALFIRNSNRKHLLMVIFVVPGVLFVRAIAFMLLAWAIQGYPLMHSDYPPGAWTALFTNLLVWILLLMAAVRLNTNTKSPSAGRPPLANLYGVIGALLLAVSMYDNLRAHWSDFNMERLWVTATNISIPFALNAGFAMTLGVIASTRFIVFTLYAAVREVFVQRWREDGVGITVAWMTVFLLLAYGGIPASFGELRETALAAGWGLAALTLWEAYPSRISAYLPYTLSSTLNIIVSASVSLGRVVR